MSKAVILTYNQWNALHQRLRADYPASVLLIKHRMREVLGFTPREHEEWETSQIPILNTRRTISMRLDFYNESKRTFFLLKYSEYLQQETASSSY